MTSGWAFALARSSALALAIGLGIGGAATALAQGAGPLRALHERLKPQLEASAFGRPLLIDSSASADDPHGVAHAVIDHDFGAVAAALLSPAQWCELLLLQSNVKRCAVSGPASAPTLRLAVGRRFDLADEGSSALEFRYTAVAATPEYLAVHLAADRGPLGTRDHRLQLEAVSIDRRRSFIRLTYAYASGLAARLATDAYLATAGRNKVGFTVVDVNPAGRPVHVRGVRGIAERSAMRCLLAIDTLLATRQLPEQQRQEMRWRHWFAATERHPLQLREMSLDEYLAIKRREAAVAP